MERMHSPRTAPRPVSSLILTAITAAVLCTWLIAPTGGAQSVERGASTSSPGAVNPGVYGGGPSSGELQREFACERGHLPPEHC